MTDEDIDGLYSDIFEEDEENENYTCPKFEPTED
jgi:hypothetical protein